MVLEKSGYTVLGVTSGSEAIGLLKALDVDLVLSDHYLRNELGTEIAAEIKALKPNLPVLIISGSEDIPNVQAVDGVISKADGPTNLLVSVARALGL
jgi:CheY-like chemotaxis protein